MTDGPVADLPPRPDAADVDWDTFVSYRHADREIAHTLAGRLAERELRVFFDERGIQLGAEWEQVIGAALDVTRSCTALVGVTGVGGVQADEVRRALERQARDPDFPVIVVLLPGALTDGFFAPYVAERSHLALGATITDDDVDRLAEAIRGLGLALPTGPERTNPYPGLRPFDRDTADQFFGRESDVDALVERATHATLVGIVGPSGTGKSSVLLAGVLPRLAALGHDVVTFRPGRHPRDAALRALGASVGATLADAVAHRAGSGRLVLAVDQLEEVRTRASDPAEATWLLDGLTELARRTDSSATVLVTIRSDRLGEINGHAAFGAALARATQLLGPLDEQGLRDAIRRPAWSRHVGFQPGLVDAMLDDLRDQPDALPLLAVTLAEMWSHRRGDRLTMEAYQAVGRVGGALAQRADAAIARAPAPTVRRTLMRLVELRPDGGAVRRRRLRTELLPADTTEAERTSVLLDDLVDARLVVASDDEGVPAYELGHDTLLRAWPLLAGLVRDDRRALELAARLAGATRDWVRSERADDSVARGAELSELQGAVADRGLSPTPDELAFLAAGQREARRVRRRAALLVGAAVAAVLALVIAAVVAVQRNDALANLVVARNEQNEAQRARAAAETDNAAAQAAKADAARALVAAQADLEATRAAQVAAEADRDAATAVRLLGEQRAAGVRLAVDAARRTTSRATRQALASAITLAPQPTLTRALGRVLAAAVVDTSTGAEAIVQRGGSTIDRCAASTGTCAAAGTPIGAAAVLRAIVTDDSGRLAALGSDGTVAVDDWRTAVANGSALALQAGDPGVVVVGTSDGRIERYLVGTAIGGQIYAGTKGIRALAVSTAGRFLAVVEDDTDGVRLMTLDGQELGQLRIGLGAVRAVAFTAGTLLVASAEGDVLAWPLGAAFADGAPQARLVGHEQPVVAMRTRGTTLVTGDAGGVIRRWDLTTTRPVGLPLPADASTGGDDEAHAVLALGIAADGASVVAVHRDGALETWPSDDRPALLTRAPSGGAVLLAATAAGRMSITATQVATAGTPVDGATAAAGMRSVVAVAAGADVVTIDPSSGVARDRWRAAATATALAASGERLAVGAADGSVTVLDNALRPVATLPASGHAIGAIALSDDATKVAIADGIDVRVVTFSTGAAVVHRGHTSPAEALAFSPDGSAIASGGDDRIVLVWRSDDASAVPLRLLGHTDRVTGLAYDARSGVLVSSGEDGTVRLWDVDGAELGSAIRIGRARVDHLVLHRDRAAVSALTLDQIVTVELGDWPARLCAAVGPTATDAVGTPDGCRA